MSIDLASTIQPKSDQLNADDLIAGPRTITITAVTKSGSPEQPIAVSYEGDGGKPYKPCKGMRRVMVFCWGSDASVYVGRSMTLFRDPTVKWAGEPVGGIRISHMSDIDKEMTLALTASRASRKPFTVKPLKIDSPQRTQSTQSTQSGAETLLGEVRQLVKLKFSDGETIDKEAMNAFLAGRDPSKMLPAELEGLRGELQAL